MRSYGKLAVLLIGLWLLPLTTLADWKLDYQVNAFGKFTRKTDITNFANSNGKSTKFPVGYLFKHNSVVESASDYSYSNNLFDPGGFNHFSVTLPTATAGDAVALDAAGDYMYFQIKDSVTGKHSLQRCTLVGCSPLKNDAGDPRAVQMGLPSHTLNPQGYIFTWYQDQATSPRTNQLSFFDPANGEHPVLQGDGYVTGVSRPVNISAGINGIASFNGQPILARLKNNQVQWWKLPSLSGIELVPVAIDGHDNPRVVMLEKNDNYPGEIFLCDIDWSLNADNELKCVGGLVNIGIRAAFNLGWYLDDSGILFANDVIQDTPGLSEHGALINTDLRQYIGLHDGYLDNVSYFYTTAYGDIVFRSENFRGSHFYMYEVDNNGDRLGDAWTDVYPATLNRPDFDEDSDGLSNFEEYQFGSNPVKADSDGDQLTDKQEKEYGGNPNSRDTDGDSVSDFDEVTKGTSLVNKDTDGDGYSDYVDDFPLDETQHVDYNNDTDGDGIPDYVEDQTQGIYSYKADSQGDVDSDGLTNLQEYHMGTNIAKADSDDDGMPDGYEISMQLDPLDPGDGAFGVDKDQDGWSNILEYRAGTSPINENEFPQKAVYSWTQSDIPVVKYGTERINYVAAPDGTIYISSYKYKKIYSVTQSGALNWSVPISINSVYAKLTAGLSGEIYLSDSNNLTALDSTGSVLWSKAGSWQVSIGENGNVYLTAGTVLVKVDSSGGELWRIATRSASRAIVGFNQIYVVDSNTLKAFSKQGELLWTYDDASSVFALDMSGQSIVMAYSRELRRISAGGELIESKIFSDYITDISGTNAVILLDRQGNIHSSHGNYHYEFNNDLEQVWKKSQSANISDSVVDAEGNLYCRLSDKLYAFDVDGQPLWVVENVEASSPVFIANNVLQLGISVYQIPTTINDNSYWGHAGKNSGNTNSACSVDDIDCDGLPEEYELKYGFDTSINDGQLDLDQDGLTNYQEFILGSEPSFKDSDGDRIPDKYEVDHGLNILVADATDDLDGDGFDNISEYLEGAEVKDSLATPEAVDGQLRWSQEHHLEGMTIDSNGTVYGYEDNYIYALDYWGDLKWRIPAGALIQPLALFSEKKLLFVDQSGIHFVNTDTGKSEIEIAGLFYRVAKTQGGFITAGANPYAISAYDDDANLLWTTEVGYPIYQLAVNGNGVIYVGAASADVSAYSSAGAFMWRHILGGSQSISPFALDSAGNLLFFQGGDLYSITERNEWNWIPVSGSLISKFAPVVDIDDAVYVVRGSKSIFKYDSAGQLEGTYNLPETPGQIAIGSDRDLIVPLSDEIRIYSKSGGERIFSYKISQYTNPPMDILVGKNRLVLSWQNDGGFVSGGKVSAVYYSNPTEPIGWTAVGGGSQHLNSVCGQIDADCDGLSDSYEISVGLDPDLRDTHWDKDSDGISNIRELQLGLNPVSADTDGDGLDDLFELANNFNPLLNDVEGDADQDGYSNMAEYLAGSDIYDATSTALLEPGVKQWERNVTDNRFVVGPDQSIYVIQGTSLVAYTVKGAELWRSQIGTSQSVRELMMSDQDSLVLLTDRQLSVYDIHSGKISWSQSSTGNYYSASALSTGDIYFSDTSGGWHYDPELTSVSSISVAGTQSFLVDSSGSVYTWFSGQLYAYDRVGNRSWSKNFLTTIEDVVLDMYGNLLIKIHGSLHQVNKSGDEVWSIQIGDSSTYETSAMVIALDGTVYLYTSGNTLIAIDRTGNLMWSLDVGKSRSSELSLDQNGDIFFLSGDSIVKVDTLGAHAVSTLSVPYSPSAFSLAEGHFYVSDGEKLYKLFSVSKDLAYGWSTARAGNHRRNSPCALIDDDCDGLPNQFEVDMGLDPATHDTLMDADGDGLINLDELILGTNAFSADTDSDGMPDGYEVQFGFDPLLDDAYDDADNDGYTNLKEYLAGSDPRSPQSIPVAKQQVQ